MFDLTSSKLLILGIIALLVVGPKDLPVLLRTLGKYMGMIRKQANEFRAQFDEAMKESELDQIRKDVENVTREAESTMRDAERSVQKEVDEANAISNTEIEKSITASTPELKALTEPPFPPAELSPPAVVNGNGAGHANGVNGPSHAPVDVAVKPVPVVPVVPAPEVKTGV